MPEYPKNPVTPAEMMEIQGGPFRTLDKPTPTLTSEKCPACSKFMGLALTMGTYKGQPRQKLVYLQCPAWVSDPAHGYGPKSPHVSAAYKAGPTPAPDADQRTTTAPAPSAPVIPTTPNADPFAIMGAAVRALIAEGIGAQVDALEARVSEMAPSLDVEAVRAMISEALANQPPKVIEIKAPGRTVRLEGVQHPALPELIERFMLGQRNFMLVGPAGTGKTTIALRFAEAIKAERRTLIACSEDMRREAIVGFKAYNVQTGETPYRASAIVEDITHPGTSVTIFEEVDASNPNTMLTVNALENGLLPTPDDTENPDKVRGADHVLLCTANTFGTAGSNVYVGRNQLDAATLDRYVTIFIDYDEKVERAVIGNEEVTSTVRAARAKMNAAGLRKVLSTRVARQVQQDRALSKYQGSSVLEIFKATLSNKGWSEAEIGRVF